MSTLPVTRSLGRGDGDMRMIEIYLEYAGNWSFGSRLTGSVGTELGYTVRFCSSICFSIWLLEIYIILCCMLINLFLHFLHRHGNSTSRTQQDEVEALGIILVCRIPMFNRVSVLPLQLRIGTQFQTNSISWCSTHGNRKNHWASNRGPNCWELLVRVSRKYQHFSKVPHYPTLPLNWVFPVLAVSTKLRLDDIQPSSTWRTSELVLASSS